MYEFLTISGVSVTVYFRHRLVLHFYLSLSIFIHDYSWISAVKPSSEAPDTLLCLSHMLLYTETAKTVPKMSVDCIRSTTDSCDLYTFRILQSTLLQKFICIMMHKQVCWILRRPMPQHLWTRCRFISLYREEHQRGLHDNLFSIAFFRHSDNLLWMVLSL